MNLVDSSEWLEYFVNGVSAEWTQDANFEEVKNVKYIDAPLRRGT